ARVYRKEIIAVSKCLSAALSLMGEACDGDHTLMPGIFLELRKASNSIGNIIKMRNVLKLKKKEAIEFYLGLGGDPEAGTVIIETCLGIDKSVFMRLSDNGRMAVWATFIDIHNRLSVTQANMIALIGTVTIAAQN